MCTRKTKSLRSHSTFFSFLQVALSLEDRSSEVKVVNHLLHVGFHLPNPLQPLQGWSVVIWYAGFTLGPKGASEHSGYSMVKRCPSQFLWSVYSMEIPQKRMSQISVLFNNALLGTGADHTRYRWVNQDHSY